MINKCIGCIYWKTTGGGESNRFCNYFFVTGKLRKCRAEVCDKRMSIKKT